VTKYLLFFAVCLIPSIGEAQVGGICFEEFTQNCATAGAGFKGPCSQTACDLFDPSQCTKTEGLTIVFPLLLYWQIREADGVGSTLWFNPPGATKCGDIYLCECDPAISANCISIAGPRAFVPQEFRIGVINCP
jgi:hypothetical protein